MHSYLGTSNTSKFALWVYGAFTHQLSQQQHITEAPFFSKVQHRFIQECQEQDADWCEVIDQLDALLRK
ncbi:DUF2789 family protein [Photobacterium leiognathi subsp. mandapamensis]|uniref:DUF2789 family protein n=1 Tax=Photobacterium leiognathi TaxID=553611 RepID=UPI003AF3953F